MRSPLASCRDARIDDDCPCRGAARRSRRPAAGASVHPTSPEHNLSVAYHGVNSWDGFGAVVAPNQPPGVPTGPRFLRNVPGSDDGMIRRLQLEDFHVSGERVIKVDLRAPV